MVILAVAWETRVKAFEIIQVRDDGGLDQNGSEGDNEKY